MQGSLLAFLSSWLPQFALAMVAVIATRGDRIRQDLFGLLGFLVGVIVSFILLALFAKPKRPRKLIEKDFGAVVLGSLITAGAIACIFKLIQGPELIGMHDGISETDLAKVQGKPDLSEVWSVNDGSAFRYPLRGYPLNLLVEAKARPRAEEQEFVGSIERLFVGGITGDELFTTEYARRNNLKGDIYLLQVMPLMGKAQWSFLAGSVILAIGLWLFVVRQGYGLKYG
jgi:uncharacterized membrane protein YhaH (DUF805 family)